MSSSVFAESASINKNRATKVDPNLVVVYGKNGISVDQKALDNLIDEKSLATISVVRITSPTPSMNEEDAEEKRKELEQNARERERYNSSSSKSNDECDEETSDASDDDDESKVADESSSRPAPPEPPEILGLSVEQFYPPAQAKQLAKEILKCAGVTPITCNVDQEFQRFVIRNDHCYTPYTSPSQLIEANKLSLEKAKQDGRRYPAGSSTTVKQYLSKRKIFDDKQQRRIPASGKESAFEIENRHADKSHSQRKQDHADDDDDDEEDDDDGGGEQSEDSEETDESENDRESDEDYAANSSSGRTLTQSAGIGANRNEEHRPTNVMTQKPTTSSRSLDPGNHDNNNKSFTIPSEICRQTGESRKVLYESKAATSVQKIQESKNDPSRISSVHLVQAKVAPSVKQFANISVQQKSDESVVIQTKTLQTKSQSAATGLTPPTQVVRQIVINKVMESPKGGFTDLSALLARSDNQHSIECKLDKPSHSQQTQQTTAKGFMTLGIESAAKNQLPAQISIQTHQSSSEIAAENDKQLDLIDSIVKNDMKVTYKPSDGSKIKENSIPDLVKMLESTEKAVLESKQLGSSFASTAVEAVDITNAPLLDAPDDEIPEDLLQHVVELMEDKGLHEVVEKAAQQQQSSQQHQSSVHVQQTQLQHPQPQTPHQQPQIHQQTHQHPQQAQHQQPQMQQHSHQLPQQPQSHSQQHLVNEPHQQQRQVRDQISQAVRIVNIPSIPGHMLGIPQTALYAHIQSLPPRQPKSIIEASISNPPSGRSTPIGALSRNQPVVSTRKEPIQIVRGNGRVITLPPIEAPTTRAKRRAQTQPVTTDDSESGDVSMQSETSTGPDFGTPDKPETSTPTGRGRGSVTRPVVRRRNAPRASKRTYSAKETEGNRKKEDEDDPNKLWCICRQPHNSRFMICCDACEDWFHGSCVNISKALGIEMELKGIDWTCPRCIKNLEEKRNPKQPPSSTAYGCLQINECSQKSNLDIEYKQIPSGQFYPLTPGEPLRKQDMRTSTLAATASASIRKGDSDVELKTSTASEANASNLSTSETRRVLVLSTEAKAVTSQHIARSTPTPKRTTRTASFSERKLSEEQHPAKSAVTPGTKNQRKLSQRKSQDSDRLKSNDTPKPSTPSTKFGCLQITEHSPKTNVGIEFKHIPVGQFYPLTPSEPIRRHDTRQASLTVPHDGTVHTMQVRMDESGVDMKSVGGSETIPLASTPRRVIGQPTESKPVENRARRASTSQQLQRGTKMTPTNERKPITGEPQPAKLAANATHVLAAPTGTAALSNMGGSSVNTNNQKLAQRKLQEMEKTERHLQFCIVCKKQARSNSIYCSDDCIRKHAQNALNNVSKNAGKNSEMDTSGTQQKLGPNEKKPKAKGLFEDVLSMADRIPKIERVCVFERRSGKILTGNSAPTTANLKKWLQDNPTFEVVLPGSQQALEIEKSKQRGRTTNISPVHAFGVKTECSAAPPSLTATAPPTSHSPAAAKAHKSKETGKVAAGHVPSVQQRHGQRMSSQSIESKPDRVEKDKNTKTAMIPTGSNIQKSEKIPEKDKDREREKDKEREREKDKEREREKDKEREREKDKEREKQKEKDNDKDNEKDKDKDKDKEKQSGQQSSTQTPGSSQKLARKHSPPPSSSASHSNEPLRLNVRRTFKEQLLQRMNKISDGPKLTTEEIEQFAKEIELEMYKLFNKDISHKYKTKYRSLIFNITDRKNETLFKKICAKLIEPGQLVRMSTEDMASQELAKWRENEVKHQLEIIKKSELDMLSCKKNYVFKTHKGEEIIDAKSLDPEKLSISMEEVVAVLNAKVSSTTEGEASTTNAVANNQPNAEMDKPSVTVTETALPPISTTPTLTITSPATATSATTTSTTTTTTTTTSTTTVSATSTSTTTTTTLATGTSRSSNIPSIDKKKSTEKEKERDRDRKHKDRHRHRDKGKNKDKDKYKEHRKDKIKTENRERSRSPHKNFANITIKKEKDEFVPVPIKKEIDSSSSDSTDAAANFKALPIYPPLPAISLVPLPIEVKTEILSPKVPKEERNSPNEMGFYGAHSPTPASSPEYRPEPYNLIDKILESSSKTVEEAANFKTTKIHPIVYSHGLNLNASTEAIDLPITEYGDNTILSDPDLEPSSTMSPSTPSENPYYRYSSEVHTFVWAGAINMIDLTNFQTTIQAVSGNTHLLAKDLSDELDVVGRICPQSVWEYIAKIKKSPNKEIVIVRLIPSGEPEKIEYSKLFSYLEDRNRLGVIKVDSPNVKDFYLMPFGTEHYLPPVLLPHDNYEFFEDTMRPAILLGIIIRIMGKNSLKARRVTIGQKRTAENALVAPLSNSTQINAEQRLTATDPKVSNVKTASTVTKPPATPRSSLTSETEEIDVDAIIKAPITSKNAPNKASTSGQAPAAIKKDDPDEPYSPGHSSDDDGLLIKDDEYKRKMDEINRQIAAQKMEIAGLLGQEQLLASRSGAIDTSLRKILSTSNLQQILSNIQQYPSFSASLPNSETDSSKTSELFEKEESTLADLKAQYEKVKEQYKMNTELAKPSRLAQLTEAELLRMVPDDMEDNLEPPPKKKTKLSEPPPPGLEDEYE